MKDEGPFILEWIAHYLAIGFDHFIINSNDCSDGTDLILDRLAEMGLVSHIRNPGPWPLGPQKAAYDNAMAHPKLAQAEWVLVCDADEFLDIKVGDHTLDALFAAAPDADVFTFIWQLFGHNGVETFTDELQTAQFTLCAPPRQIHPMQSRAIKSLFRNNGTYRRLSTHRPKGIVRKPTKLPLWVDGSGDPVPAFTYGGWAFRNTGQGYGDTLGRMNHYAVRSLQSYLMKRMRGDVNTTSFHGKMEQSGATYWRLHCWNNVENLGLASRATDLAIRRDKLCADSRLRQLHDGAVAYHMERIQKLIDTPQYADFKSNFLNYSSDRTHHLHDNVLTDPTQAFDKETFNISSLLIDFQVSRIKEYRTARKANRHPWFAGMDALETAVPKGKAPAIGKYGTSRADVADTLPALPAALLTGIQAAIAARQAKAPHRPAARRFFARASNPRCKTWLLIGGRDLDLIDDILGRSEVETLYVVDPWGLRDQHMDFQKVLADPARHGADQVFFETITLYSDVIKQGRLRVIRSTPASALKLLHDGFFDVVMIAGDKAQRKAGNLLHIVAPKLAVSGVLMVNSYRQSASGAGMMAALHSFIARDPACWRVMTSYGAYIAIERLPPITDINVT